MSTTASIDLDSYRLKGARVFVGRPFGKAVRKNSRINQLAEKYEKVVIRIPQDIGAINPSFLEEFLFNVVRKYGVEEFHSKFEFDNPGAYKIDFDLEEALDRILKSENALSEA